MNLKPYSLVHPVVVKTPRPVVLSPSCIAPRLIRNLLDLPTSRLDFTYAQQVGSNEWLSCSGLF